MATEGQSNVLSDRERLKKFFLILRRALIMVVRAIEEMYPEQFGKQQR